MSVTEAILNGFLTWHIIPPLDSASSFCLPVRRACVLPERHTLMSSAWDMLRQRLCLNHVASKGKLHRDYQGKTTGCLRFIVRVTNPGDAWRVTSSWLLETPVSLFLLGFLCEKLRGLDFRWTLRCDTLLQVNCCWIWWTTSISCETWPSLLTAASSWSLRPETRPSACGTSKMTVCRWTSRLKILHSHGSVKSCGTRGVYCQSAQPVKWMWVSPVLLKVRRCFLFLPVNPMKRPKPTVSTCLSTCCWKMHFDLFFGPGQIFLKTASSSDSRDPVLTCPSMSSVSQVIWWRSCGAIRTGSTAAPSRRTPPSCAPSAPAKQYVNKFLPLLVLVWVCQLICVQSLVTSYARSAS